MIDPIQAGMASDPGRLSQSTASAARPTAPSSTDGLTSFAGRLARFVSTAPDEVKAPARPDNGQTRKVAGHPLSRIDNGADKGVYLNQLQSSPRAGTVFKLVERDERVFHVYGSGKEKVVVEVRKKDAAAATGGATPTTT